MSKEKLTDTEKVLLGEEIDPKKTQLEKVFESQTTELAKVEEKSMNLEEMFEGSWDEKEAIEVTSVYFSPTELGLKNGDVVRGIFYEMATMQGLENKEELNRAVKFFAKTPSDEAPRLYICASTILVSVLSQFEFGDKCLITYLGKEKAKTGQYDSFSVKKFAK